MTTIVWHSGPPPHIGWWNASHARSLSAWRWWDGERWSFPANPGRDSAKEAAHFAAIPADRHGAIEWNDSYPVNARVPRIDPTKKAIAS